MTIAGVYLSAEGVVLGADSTTTNTDALGKRFYNHAQKIFEIGQDSSLAAVTWGLGGLNVSSYRTLFALLADSFKHKKPKSLAEVAKLWSMQFWDAYSKSHYLKDIFAITNPLIAKKPYDPSATVAALDARTAADEVVLQNARNLFSVGFCICGYVLPSRTPSAFVLFFDPTLSAAPAATEMKIGWQFWGMPNIVQRVQFGHETELKQKLISSGKWSGSEADLDAILTPYTLDVPPLPVRDALDFIHTNILTTIKTHKFSSVEPGCGGSIELGLVTADRNFRWVKHKKWSSALLDGECSCLT